MSTLLRGAPVAERLTLDLSRRSAALRHRGVIPTLAILRVGSSPGDLAYEKSAAARCARCGIEVRRLFWDSAAPLADAIRAVNADPSIHGCLLLRPGKVMQMDNPENPRIMEDFIRAIGAEPVLWANRNECCGGYVALEDPESAHKKSAAVAENAASQGAEAIVTACPLCKYNLVKNGSPLPVVYFTELLAEALGVKEDIHAE